MMSCSLSFFYETQYSGYSASLPTRLRETPLAVQLFHNPKSTRTKWTKHCAFRSINF